MGWLKKLTKPISKVLDKIIPNEIKPALPYLSAFAPVDVIVVQGNHDFERMFYAGEVLSAWFKNDQGVLVDNGLDSRKYYEYGVNMIMFTFLYI